MRVTAKATETGPSPANCTCPLVFDLSATRSAVEEKCVVHRNVDIVGGALIDQRVSAVATNRVSPGSAGCLLQLSAVVLSSADRDISVDWMYRNTLELKSTKRSIVQVCPRAACCRA